MKPGTQSDIVKEFGCSRTAISKLVKAKDYRIIYTPGKKINVEATVKALKDSGFGKRSKKQPGKAPKIETPTDEEHKEDLKKEGPLKVTDTRERIARHKEFQQAEKFRIENEKNLKKLIDVDEIAERVFVFIRKFREHQQGQKDRIGTKLEGSETRHEIERILEDDNHNGLTTIAANFDDLSDDELKKKILLRLIQ